MCVTTQKAKQKSNKRLSYFLETISIRLSLSGLFNNYRQFSGPTEERSHPAARANIKKYQDQQHSGGDFILDINYTALRS